MNVGLKFDLMRMFHLLVESGVIGAINSDSSFLSRANGTQIFIHKLIDLDQINGFRIFRPDFASEPHQDKKI